MAREEDPPVRIDNCTCTRETDAAIFVQCDDWDEPMWMPKSVVDEDSDVYKRGTDGVLVIKAWFAKKHDLE